MSDCGFSCSFVRSLTLRVAQPGYTYEESADTEDEGVRILA
jgi:hypothetical protein